MDKPPSRPQLSIQLPSELRKIRTEGARVIRMRSDEEETDEDVGRTGIVSINGYNAINGRNMTVIYDVSEDYPEPKKDTTCDPNDFKLYESS